MITAFISHPECFAHDTGPVHPESAARLYAIQDQLVMTRLFDFLRHVDAPEATREQILRVHDAAHLTHVEAAIPAEGHAHLDPDTIICPHSLKAALRAAGAVVHGVDLVMRGEVTNAFCAVRPPGHHAERDHAMGFCLFNNVAVGAAHALQVHGLERVAILDFDVHHGNGTEDAFDSDPRVLFCSSFQYPFYPNTALLPDTDRRVSVPLAAGAQGAEFRAGVEAAWLPALDAFRPQLILVSAGFDAHEDDDMSGVRFNDADYRWITERIVEVAARHADGRVVSTLEGGYELHSLARGVENHLRVLMGLH